LPYLAIIVKNNLPKLAIFIDLILPGVVISRLKDKAAWTTLTVYEEGEREDANRKRSCASDR
jgi:hypothetical protein